MMVLGSAASRSTEASHKAKTCGTCRWWELTPERGPSSGACGLTGGPPNRWRMLTQREDECMNPPKGRKRWEVALPHA